MLRCGIVYFMVGYGSQTVLRARPKAARIVGRASGSIMIVLAFILVAEKFVQKWWKPAPCHCRADR